MHQMLSRLGLAVLLTSTVFAAPPLHEHSVALLGDQRLRLCCSQPFAIDERGDIVGKATGGPSIWRATLWEKGTPIDLGTLKYGFESAAHALNRRGQVVGVSITGCFFFPTQPYPFECTHAFLWDQGTMVDLGGLGGPSTFFSEAWGINDRGQIVGASTADGGPGTHAVLWDKGSITDLGTLPGDSLSSAMAINNRGQIVGYSGDGVTSRAFLWEDGTMIELPGQSDRTFAYDINKRGQIVGTSDGPVLWEDGVLTALERPAGTFDGGALGINDRGQIVGYLRSSESNTLHVAVLWSDGEVVTLPTPPNTFVPNDTFATDINNRGDIIGQAPFSSVAEIFGLLWTPQHR